MGLRQSLNNTHQSRILFLHIFFRSNNLWGWGECMFKDEPLGSNQIIEQPTFFAKDTLSFPIFLSFIQGISLIKCGLPIHFTLTLASISLASGDSFLLLDSDGSLSADLS